MPIVPLISLSQKAKRHAYMGGILPTRNTRIKYQANYDDCYYDCPDDCPDDCDCKDYDYDEWDCNVCRDFDDFDCDSNGYPTDYWEYACGD